VTMTASPGPIPVEPTAETVPGPSTAARPGLVGRLVRCAGVSAITTVLSLAIIVFGTVALGLEAALANVIATGIATVPSYSLNRRWTWAKTDASDLWREVVPFWVLSFAGLALSTVTVAMADGWASRMHLAPTLHTAAILVGHLGGFGLLWIVQFVLLDRVLFVHKSTRSDDEVRNDEVRIRPA